MATNHSGDGSGGPPVGEARGGPKFKSVRRVLRIMDLIGLRGEELTAKELAREVGTNLSSCYYLLNVLAEEGYIEKVPRKGGYRIGPAVSLLREGSRGDFEVRIDPVVEELAQRTQRQTYVAVLSGGEMEVARVKVPPGSPPVGVVEGFHGASHALATGKVLLAGMGSEYVEGYIADHGLEAFTTRTIVRPAQLHAHLNKVRMVGVALDFEEFAQNLCCVAAPVKSQGGKVAGAIGLSTTTRRMASEGQRLIEMVRRAAGEASALIEEVAHERRS